MSYRFFTRRAFLSGAAGACGTFVYASSHNDTENVIVESPNTKIATKSVRRDFQPVAAFWAGKKSYTKAEVAAHNKKSTGIWVTKGDQVYDISEFVEQHPGGAKILLAAGKSIDP